jgi:hypothetical protein
MSDEQNDSSAATPPPRPRHPAPTIDLKATEVSVEPKETPAADPSAAAPESSQPQTDVASPEEPSAAGGGAPPPGRSAAARPASGWRYAAAAAAGALAVLAAFAALWWAGAFAADRGAMAALNERLSRLAAQVGELASRPAPPAADRKALDALTARVAKLEQTVASLAAQPPAGAPANADQLAAIDKAIKSLQENVADLAQRADANAASAREARSRADAARSAAGQDNVEALRNRVAALEQSAKTLADEIAKRPTSSADRPLRLAVAARALRAAVERGDPFAPELAALKPLVSDSQQLQALESFAASGVPSASALAQQLAKLAPAMRQRTAPKVSGGFLDRLQAGAGRLIRIRPIGETTGDDPDAVIGRAEAEAARSDIAGALAALSELPAEVRAPAQDWIKQAQARQTALAASVQLENDALAALGKPTP